MSVPILKQGNVIIVTLQAALTDAELEVLRGDVAAAVGDRRVKGLILDVSALDVLDSFATGMLLKTAKIAGLRGAEVVIVGVQPDVAFATVQLGLSLEGVDTALDLEDGLELLETRWKGGSRAR